MKFSISKIYCSPRPDASGATGDWQPATGGWLAAGRLLPLESCPTQNKFKNKSQFVTGMHGRCSRCFRTTSKLQIINLLAARKASLPILIVIKPKIVMELAQIYINFKILKAIMNQLYQPVRLFQKYLHL